MEWAAKARDWFWSEGFWLPPNTTWTDLKRDENIFIPTAGDLIIPFYIAVLLFGLRMLWERFVAVPWGRYYELSERLPRPPTPNPELEEIFKKNKRLTSDHNAVEALAKKVDMTPRQIERWWRRRRLMGKPTELKRFTETSWRFLFYLAIFWYGIYVLWDKPWFWDTKHCWYGYPRQHVTTDIWWYYMVELGFYWSLIISLVIDNKRKDFVEMIVHHVATILLMTLSWANNMVRVGTLVLAVHDAVDYWMEGAKLTKYMKYHRLCDALFVVFTIVWFITRICIYPLRILYATIYEGPSILGLTPHFIFGNIFTIILQVLHIWWFSIICKMAYQFITHGQFCHVNEARLNPAGLASKALDLRKKTVIRILNNDYPLSITWVLNSSILESATIVGMFPGFVVFNGLLIVLQILDIVWFSMILRLVHEFLTTGKVEKDERSETEPEITDEDEQKEMPENGVKHVNVPNGLLTSNGTGDVHLNSNNNLVSGAAANGRKRK